MNNTNTERPRTEDGIAIELPDGRAIVPADVLALLSGVNFGSIEKVLAAINALHGFSGTDLALLLDLAAVPTERVRVGDPRFAHREHVTLEVCEDIADWADTEIDDLLRLSGRFP